MDTATAIRTRRTHKAFKSEPVPRRILEELFELARWAPNHNLTNPWRFRVIGPHAMDRLKAAAGAEAAPKLDRAPTLVVCSCVRSGDDVRRDVNLKVIGALQALPCGVAKLDCFGIFRGHALPSSVTLSAL